MTRRKVVPPKPRHTVQVVRLNSRPVCTVHEREVGINAVRLPSRFEGSLVRFVPDQMSSEEVQRTVVPMLKSLGAAAVKVAPREGKSATKTEPRGSVAEDTPPQHSVRIAAIEVISHLRNVDAKAVLNIVDNALSKAGL